MSRSAGYVCRDFGRPLCCSVPDPRYTMRFDNIGEEPIYWCTHCGKYAAALDAIIDNAFKTQPGFAERFERAIKLAEEKEKHDDQKEQV